MCVEEWVAALGLVSRGLRGEDNGNRGRALGRGGEGAARIWPGAMTWGRDLYKGQGTKDTRPLCFMPPVQTLTHAVAPTHPPTHLT